MARAKTPGIKKFNIYLSTAVVAALDHLAKLRSTTRAELVRNVLRDYAKAELVKERDEPELEDLIRATPAGGPVPEGTAEVPIDLPALGKTIIEDQDGNPVTQRRQPSGAIRIS